MTLTFTNGTSTQALSDSGGDYNRELNFDMELTSKQEAFLTRWLEKRKAPTAKRRNPTPPCGQQKDPNPKHYCPRQDRPVAWSAENTRLWRIPASYLGEGLRF
jgi:hypothetical protein